MKSFSIDVGIGFKPGGCREHEECLFCPRNDSLGGNEEEEYRGKGKRWKIDNHRLALL